MVIAIFILLIACFNFINLNTAGALARAKETGVQKVLGARQSQLISKFFSRIVFVVYFLYVDCAHVGNPCTPNIQYTCRCSAFDGFIVSSRNTFCFDSLVDPGKYYSGGLSFGISGEVQIN